MIRNANPTGYGYDYRIGYVPLPPPVLVRRRHDQVFSSDVRPLYRTPCDRCGIALGAPTSDLLAILVDAHLKRAHGVMA